MKTKIGKKIMGSSFTPIARANAAEAKTSLSSVNQKKESNKKKIMNASKCKFPVS
jgi:hypothetical protein